MSTRANVIIKDGDQELIFYRHSDGYPDGARPTLDIMLQWLKDGKIRDNISQASGWLVILGAIEYNTIPTFKTEEVERPLSNEVRLVPDLETIELQKSSSGMGWKAGAYEPTICIHGDIEYLYILDLQAQTIKTLHRDSKEFKDYCKQSLFA